VLRRLEGFGIGDAGISSITAAELRFGAEKSADPVRNHAALDLFLLPLEIADFGDAASSAYGRVRSMLEQCGTPIGPLDTLTAAHALSLHVTLVTNNVREFGRIPGLEVEDWTVKDG